MQTDYDLIVIGAGPAGTPAAMAAAKFGAKVLLIDKRDAPGGECLFEGCIPSKVLESAANHFNSVKEAKIFHIDFEKAPQIHWENVLKDKEEIIKKRSLAALKQIKMLPTLSFKQGSASFIDANSLKVNDEVFTFKKAIIATGAKSFIPKIEGNGIDKVWTNADIFYNKEIPDEILFIGAGAISCEFVQMFNKLGVKCHILERSERILKHIDEDAALLVQDRMLQSGIEIDFNVNLEKIDYENGYFLVYFNQNGKERVLKYKHVVMATGRIANFDGLALENAKVEYDKKGIIVNENLQSSQAHIYAAGDCINSPKFAHTASYEAGIAVHNLFAPKAFSVNYDKNSWVLFSDPQVAVAGIDEQSATKRGIDYIVEKYDYKIDARAQIEKRVDGFLKFIIDKKSQAVIGAVIVSPAASSLVGEAALIVVNKMTPMDIMQAIHPHPTLNEAFGKLSQEIFFKNMMKMKIG